LKIASSGRGALAGTRWAHFNFENKKARRLVGEGQLREDQHRDQKANTTRREDDQFTIFSVPVLESIRSSRDSGHE
jgi:hypothetical protein